MHLLRPVRRKMRLELQLFLPPDRGEMVDVSFMSTSQIMLTHEAHLIVDDSQRHAEHLALLVEKAGRGHIVLGCRGIFGCKMALHLLRDQWRFVRNCADISNENDRADFAEKKLLCSGRARTGVLIKCDHSVMISSSSHPSRVGTSRRL